MIPGSFAYHRPTSVGDAIALLADLGDARPLAGGHSPDPDDEAAPRRAAGTGRPRGNCPSSAASRREGGSVVIGATPHDYGRTDRLPTTLPPPSRLSRETALVIADPQVRARGTIGGNVASGDPGNDMPALMQCLNASYLASGRAGPREILRSARGSTRAPISPPSCPVITSRRSASRCCRPTTAGPTRS